MVGMETYPIVCILRLVAKHSLWLPWVAMELRPKEDIRDFVAMHTIMLVCKYTL